MNSQPFAELISAYLDGVPGAADVLNDALEESGRSRVVTDGDTGERLAIVLEELLVEPLARRVALDFARHVAGYCEPAHVQNVLKAKEHEAALQSGATTAASNYDNDEVAHRSLHQGMLHSLGWEEEDSPKSSAAWALWGALLIPVRYVAQAAQRANTTELQWQVEHLKKLLMSPLEC